MQRGCSGSAGRQAAGHRQARVVQDVLRMRCLRARHGGMDWRRPEQSGSKRVLHSHIEQAPPPPGLAEPHSSCYPQPCEWHCLLIFFPRTFLKPSTRSQCNRSYSLRRVGARAEKRTVCPALSVPAGTCTKQSITTSQ